MGKSNPTVKGLDKRLEKVEQTVTKILDSLNLGDTKMDTAKHTKVQRDLTKPEWRTFHFKCGDLEIATADFNGVLVFRDAVFEAPFDDKEDWRQCTNVYDNSTLKKLLEKWWEENAPQVLKDNYTVDLLEDYEIFDTDQLPEEYRIGKQLTMFKDWHNRIKGLKGERYSTWWWTKTALRGNVHGAIGVYTTGYRNGDYASHSNGVVPCLRPIERSDQ